MWTLYFAAVVSSCFFLFFFLLFFSPILSSQLLDANSECRSEICCMRLAENTGCNKLRKNCNLRSIAQLCRAIPSQLRHVSTPHHNRFTALSLGPPGWASARRELLDFMVQGKINRGRHADHPVGRHSMRTNQYPPLPSPHFKKGQMAFLPPNQQCQSTEGN